MTSAIDPVLRRAGPWTVALLVALGAPSQASASPVASYATPGCATAPEWKIAYRLFWSDDAGATTTRDALPDVLAAAEGFAHSVGTAADCGARVRVDVFDEPDAWPAALPQGDHPPGTDAFAQGGGYDAVMDRRPESDGTHVGANGWDGTGTAAVDFPVDPTGETWGDGAPGPRAMLLMWGWVQLVTQFYSPALGWPADGVNGACTHGYAGSCAENEAYFGDLLTGNVLEDGVRKGITAEDFASRGTPTSAARRAHLDTKLGWSPVDGISLAFPADLDVAVESRAVDEAGATRFTHTGGSWTWWPESAGTYRICFWQHASRRYEPIDACYLPSRWAPGTLVRAPGRRGVAGGAASASACRVPSLSRRTLKQARARLKKALCALGFVDGRRSRRGFRRVVVRQEYPRGSVLATGSTVDVEVVRKRVRRRARG